MQPKKLQERLQLAGEFACNYGLASVKLLVEDPELDSLGFDATYAAWPTRFYILKGRELAWIASPDENHEYDSALEGLERLVNEECAQQM